MTSSAVSCAINTPSTSTPNPADKQSCHSSDSAAHNDVEICEEAGTADSLGIVYIFSDIVTSPASAGVSGEAVNSTNNTTDDRPKIQENHQFPTVRPT